MAYADRTFYNAVYRGTVIPAADLMAALDRAAQSIDMATRYQIRELERWPAFTQEQIKLATCAEADHAFQYGDTADMLDVVGGYSIGDVSISRGGAQSGKGAVAEHYGLSKKAMMFLLPTGLLDRRLR